MGGELANFPIVPQRDGNVNGYWNCVPASIAAALIWYTGKTFSAGQLKDACYSPAYTGPTAAQQYINYCQAQRIRLYPVTNSNNQTLISYALFALQNNIPVLFTEPDPYSSLSGASHVVVAYKYDDSGITVMDPYIAGPVSKTYGMWASELLYSQIWMIEKMVPNGWIDDGTILKATNGQTVQHGFRDYILNHTWDANNVPLEGETGGDPLIESDPTVGKGSRQIFRDGVLYYTPARGSFYGYAGQELLTLRGEKDKALAEVAALQKQLDAAKASAGTDTRTIVQQVLTLLNPLIQ